MSLAGLTLIASAMPAAADVGPQGKIVVTDCFGTGFTITGASLRAAYWQIFIEGHERVTLDGFDGNAFTFAGVGMGVKSIVLKADGQVVDAYHGPYCY
jgi:hypothetical protein